MGHALHIVLAPQIRLIFAESATGVPNEKPVLIEFLYRIITIRDRSKCFKIYKSTKDRQRHCQNMDNVLKTLHRKHQ